MKMKWGRWQMSEGSVGLIGDSDKNVNYPYLKKDNVK